jgi:hypothetical protein
MANANLVDITGSGTTGYKIGLVWLPLASCCDYHKPNKF